MRLFATRSRAVGLAAATLLGAVACAEPSGQDTHAAAVVGADVDTGDPEVVALVTSSGRIFCTGTLVAPMVVLTAAHCLGETGGDPDLAAFFGNDINEAGNRAQVIRYQTHPGWNGNISGGHDLALLLLNAPQDLALVKPMNRRPLEGMVGAPYRAVGFGIHDRDTRELDGKKRVGQFQLTGYDGDYIQVGDVDADGATAICQGDSGGPGFMTFDGVEYLAGIHTYSIEGCFNPSGDSRPDRYMDSFIQPYIDANDITCGANEQCVRVGCSADPDCEPCGPDGTCASGCALPDPDCATAALGDICRADTQCMTGLCVPWATDMHSRFCSQPCTGPADCPAPGMTCDAVPGSGMVCNYRGEPPGAIGQACDAPTDCSRYSCIDGACTYACDITRGLLCPTGYSCASHDNGQSYNCFAPEPPADEGGCCSSSGGTASIGLGLAVAAVIGRRRRHEDRS